jgi:gas vesicle protein
MKHIEWHNPANQTPPKGYRLLIPEEVDGRFNSQDCKAVRLYCEELEGWAGASPLITADFIRYSYAVPSDTPLPEGYALIDGQAWRLDGWTAHTPAAQYDVTGKAPMDPSIMVEVQYRNGTRCTAPMKQHYFGQLKSKDAEIIAWRIVEQAPEPKQETREYLTDKCKKLFQTIGYPSAKAELYKRGYTKVAHMPDEVLRTFVADMEELVVKGKVEDRDAGTGLHIPTEAIKTATSQLMDRIGSFYHELAQENQRLKNELADAQATLKSIRSLLP